MHLAPTMSLSRKFVGAYRQAYFTLAYKSWYVNQSRLSVAVIQTTSVSGKNLRWKLKLEIMRFEVPKTQCDRGLYFG